MATKKIKFGVIVDCEEANVLDSPEAGSPIVCQIKAGTRVVVLSKPNKKFVGIGVSHSVLGFVAKEFIKAE